MVGRGLSAALDQTMPTTAFREHVACLKFRDIRRRGTHVKPVYSTERGVPDTGLLPTVTPWRLTDFPCSQGVSCRVAPTIGCCQAVSSSYVVRACGHPQKMATSRFASCRSAGGDRCSSPSAIPCHLDSGSGERAPPRGPAGSGKSRGRPPTKLLRPSGTRNTANRASVFASTRCPPAARNADTTWL